MARETIIIDIAPGGDVKIEVDGCSGPACKALTAPLEKALGTVSKSVEKREMRDARTDNRIVNRR